MPGGEFSSPTCPAIAFSGLWNPSVHAFGWNLHSRQKLSGEAEGRMIVATCFCSIERKLDLGWLSQIQTGSYLSETTMPDSRNF